jgi:hypothetical protein
VDDDAAVCLAEEGEEVFADRFDPMEELAVNRGSALRKAPVWTRGLESFTDQAAAQCARDTVNACAREAGAERAGGRAGAITKLTSRDAAALEVRATRAPCPSTIDLRSTMRDLTPGREFSR